MSGRNFTYHEQKETDYTLQLRQLLTELPPYVKDYFRAIEPKTSAKTRISYAYDLQVFFRFLTEVNPVLSDRNLSDPRVTMYIAAQKSLTVRLSQAKAIS